MYVHFTNYNVCFLVCFREPNDLKDGKGIHVDDDKAWYYNTEGQANQQNTYSPTNYNHVRSGFLVREKHPL